MAARTSIINTGSEKGARFFWHGRGWGRASVVVFLVFLWTASAHGQCAVQTPIASSAVVNGSLQIGDCTIADLGLDPDDISFADQYVVTLLTSGTLTITLQAAAFDAFLWLFSSSVTAGNFITFDDDGGGGTNSSISVILGPGTYIILANSAFADQADTGSYMLSTNFTASSGSPTERLVNISTRGRVLSGDNAMIGGFIISGSAPKRILIRSRGPSISGAPFMVPGTLGNPSLRLFSGQSVIAQNDNWQDAPSCSGFVCEGAAAISATGLDPCAPNPGQAGPPPNCALESVILITLPPGGYTAIVNGADGGTGVGLVEIFEADSSPLSELSNISTRAFVQTGDSIIIGGLIIEASAPKTVLIRARGPSMGGAPFNLNGTLANPLLQLFSGQNIIAFNDNWRERQEEEIAATGLDPCQPNPGETVAPPGCDQESAMVLDLPAGGYTAWMTGVGGQTGIGLMEIFEAPEVIIPNALGTFTGAANVALNNCQNAANNGLVNFSSTLNITSQNGSIINGTGALSGPNFINLNITGTATAGADTMGSFTFTQAGASGNGTFAGSLTGNMLTLNFTGQFVSGESCTVNGSLSGTR